MKSSHLIEGRDEVAAKLDKFIPVYELNHEFLFGDATYEINNRRQKMLQKRTELPFEEDVKKLRVYTIHKVEKMNDDFLSGILVLLTHLGISLSQDLPCLMPAAAMNRPA